MKKFSTIPGFLVCSFLAISLFGCDIDDVRGGGWITVREDRATGKIDQVAKVTFGFQVDCDDETNEVHGQLQWHDPLQEVHFHAELDFVLDGECSEEALFDSVLGGAYDGIYTPHPAKLGEPGEVHLYVIDQGEPGPDEEDYIGIELIGGAFDGYALGGELGGGNISVK